MLCEYSKLCDPCPWYFYIHAIVDGLRALFQFGLCYCFKDSILDIAASYIDDDICKRGRLTTLSISWELLKSLEFVLYPPAVFTIEIICINPEFDASIHLYVQV